MKRVTFIILFGLVLAACDVSTQDSKDAKLVNDQQAHYAKVQPIPYFDFSMDRDTLVQIYKAKNEARQTHSVVASMTGAILWDCPSIGFPIPADTQLTNPLVGTGRYIYDENGQNRTWVEGIVEQAEPNGLFSSKNTDATFVQCVGPDGSVSPIYTEQKVTTFPFPVKIIDGQIVRAGDASIVLDINPGSEGTAPTP